MSDEKARIGIVESVRRRVGGLGSRVSWPLQDGKIAKDSLQEKTKTQIRDVLRATLADPELVAELGIADAVPKPAPAAADLGDLKTEDVAQVALELLSRGAVELAKRRYVERIAQLAGLTVDERKQLAPLASKVIDKYLPDTLGKYGEELALASALLALTIAKLQMMREADKREHANIVVPAA